MKKFMKIASLICALAIVVASFAGCGAENKDNTVIRIGGIGPLTGGAAIYGQAVKNNCY